MNGKELVMYIVANDLFDAKVKVEVTAKVTTEVGTDMVSFTSDLDDVSGQYRDKTVILTCEGDVDLS